MYLYPRDRTKERRRNTKTGRDTFRQAGETVEEKKEKHSESFSSPLSLAKDHSELSER